MIEALVALLATSLVVGAALSVTLSTRRLLDKDQGRTRVDQELRIGLELLGIEVRQAGERLPEDFPAVELIDGAAGAPDRLVIRRNMLDIVLPLCEQIDQGTSTTEVRIADSGASPPQGCPPVADDDADTWPDNLQEWRALRDAQAGVLQAYVYNPVDRDGEFFVYDGDGATTDYIHKADTGTWLFDYGTAQQCRIYVLEERTFELVGDVLRLVINGDTAGAQTVLYGVSDFQLRAVMDDGSILDGLDSDGEWKDLAAVEVAIEAEAEVGQQMLTRAVSSRFFPRNVLSL